MQISEGEVQEAVERGLKATLSDPGVHAALVAGLSEALGQKAKKEAGNWLWGQIKTFINRAVWFVVISLVLAKVGGLPAVLAWWKAA